jgi:hypothetical protein
VNLVSFGRDQAMSRCRVWHFRHRGTISFAQNPCGTRVFGPSEPRAAGQLSLPEFLVKTAARLRADCALSGISTSADPRDADPCGDSN